MKLFWFSLIFYVIYQKLPVASASPFNYLTDAEEELMNGLGNQISNILEAKSTATFSSEDYDAPRVQNFGKIYEDELLNGNMLLYNTIIDGLTEISEDVSITVDQDDQEIRMTVNLKQVTVDGEFIFATLSDVDASEMGIFSVTFSNVRIEGVASLMADPNGDMVITKVISTVWNREFHVSVNPLFRTAVTIAILKSATIHLQNNAEKQLAKIAITEVSRRYRRRRSHPPSKVDWTIFEAQRFLNEHYNPYTVKMISDVDPSLSSPFFGPINIDGLSNIHLDDLVMSVNNSLINVYARILITTVHVNFPFSMHQKRYNGECSIEKMDFIGKMQLEADNSKRTPLMAGLGMEMSGCKCHLRNKATGMRVHVNQDEFGMDANELFCLVIRSEISTSKITKTIQTEIFDKMDLSYLEEEISQVWYEELFFGELYH